MAHKQHATAIAADEGMKNTATAVLKINGLRQTGDGWFELSDVELRGINLSGVAEQLVESGFDIEEAEAEVEAFGHRLFMKQLAKIFAERIERVG